MEKEYFVKVEVSHLCTGDLGYPYEKTPHVHLYPPRYRGLELAPAGGVGVGDRELPRRYGLGGLADHLRSRGALCHIRDCHTQGQLSSLRRFVRADDDVGFGISEYAYLT